MQDLKIALVQCNQHWQDKAANLLHYEELLKDVDVELILLPEMFQTGFTMNASALAENKDECPSVNWLKEIAKNKNTAIYTSLIYEEGGQFFNRGVFVFPTGEFQIYDKRKSFGLAGENKFFTQGNSTTIVSYLGWKFQLQICYDLRFPEIARNQMLSNQFPAYDVLLYVANWPEKRAHHWNSLLVARAIENQCYVVAVNRVGKDANGHYYSGDSQVVDANGEVNKCKEGKEMVKTVVIKHEELNQIREMLPFLKDR